jgi:hypothetical protein
MVLTGGGGKEADMLVKFRKGVYCECNQVYNYKANVSFVSLIIEIHHAPQAEYRNHQGFVMRAASSSDPSAEVAFARTR